MVFDPITATENAKQNWVKPLITPDPNTPAPTGDQTLGLQQQTATTQKKSLLGKIGGGLESAGKVAWSLTKTLVNPKTYLWDIPKDVVQHLVAPIITTNYYNLTHLNELVARKGQPNMTEKSPMAQMWYQQQNETAMTWAALRNPGASHQQLQTIAQGIIKDHPFLTAAPGPINSMLDATILEGFIGTVGRQVAMRAASTALKGFAPELQAAAVAARGYVSADAFQVALKEGKAVLPEGFKATDFYEQASKAQTIRQAIGDIKPGLIPGGVKTGVRGETLQAIKSIAELPTGRVQIVTRPLTQAAQWFSKTDLYNSWAESLRSSEAMMEKIKNEVLTPLKTGKTVFNRKLITLFKAMEKEGQFSFQDTVDYLQGTMQLQQARVGKAVLNRGTLTPAVGDVVDYLSNMYKGQLSRLQAAGVKVTEDAWGRTIAPMIQDELASRFPETAKMNLADATKYAGEHGVSKEEVQGFIESFIQKNKVDPVYFNHLFMDKLHFSDIFIPRALSTFKKGYRKQFGGVADYMKDPVLASSMYKGATESDILQKNFWNSFLDGSMLDSAKIPNYAEADIPQELKKGFKFVKPDKMRFYAADAEGGGTRVGVTFNTPGRWVPKNVARQIEQTSLSMKNASNFASKYLLDLPVDIWRVFVLAGSARWYVNNTIGNVMLNALAGVGPLDYVKFGGKQYDKYIPDQIKEQIAKGAVGTERTSRYGLVGKAAEKIHVTGIVESLYGINQKIEGWFRGVHYKKMAYQYANDIYKGDPGMYTRLADFAKAHDFEGDVKGIMATDKGIQQKSIDSVDKFLFDYSNLTQFERNTIRRAIPFYSWYKNIFRLTAQTAYEQPAKLALMYKLYQGLGPVADPDMPQWIRNKIPVPLTFKDPNTGKTQPMFLNVRAAVPFFDVLKMTDPNEIMASLNPIAKVAIERSLKIQLFTGRPFTSPYYNTYTGMVYDKNSGLAVQGPPLPSLLRHIGMQIPAFTFIEDIVKPYAKYDSGDPITTPSGEAKYPNAVFVTLLKQAGINLMPFDAAQYIQSQKSKAQSTITSGKKVQRGIQQFNLNQESKKKVDQKLEDVKVYQPIF